MSVRVGMLGMPRPPMTNIIRRCQDDEALGLDSVWLRDHFVDQALGPLIESWTLLAKMATTVDHLASGRLELGVGVGWWQPELDQFDYAFPPPADRAAHFTETVSGLKRLFGDDEVVLHDASWLPTKAVMRPKPIQWPHPPLVLAA